MINQLKLYVMAMILIIAGVVHLIRPESFLIAMPPYIPWHIPIIYITGVIELVFVALLISERHRYRASKLLALYFIAIWPAHFHVSINNIPMFGIDNPLLLWGRTLFQLVFIYWAYSLRKLSKL